MAHQNWSQANERLRGALQNVGIEVILKAGRMDAEYSARVLASVDPMEVKHTVADERAEERTHPAYLSLPEQWERHVQAIQRLKIGEAFIRLADDSVHKIATSALPRVTALSEEVRAVKETYLRRYFVPIKEAVVAATASRPVAHIGRRSGARHRVLYRKSS
jgi:hypothetical protein